MPRTNHNPQSRKKPVLYLWSSAEDKALVKAYEQFYQQDPPPGGRVENWVAGQLPHRSARAVHNRFEAIKNFEKKDGVGYLSKEIDDIKALANRSTRPWFLQQDEVLVNTIRNFYVLPVKPEPRLEDWVAGLGLSEFEGRTPGAIADRWHNIAAFKTKYGTDYLRAKVEDIEAARKQVKRVRPSTYQLWTDEQKRLAGEYANNHKNPDNDQVDWRDLREHWEDRYKDHFPGKTPEMVKHYTDVRLRNTIPPETEDCLNVVTRSVDDKVSPSHAAQLNYPPPINSQDHEKHPKRHERSNPQSVIVAIPTGRHQSPPALSSSILSHYADGISNRVTAPQPSGLGSLETPRHSPSPPASELLPQFIDPRLLELKTTTPNISDRSVLPDFDHFGSRGHPPLSLSKYQPRSRRSLNLPRVLRALSRDWRGSDVTDVGSESEQWSD